MNGPARFSSEPPDDRGLSGIERLYGAATRQRLDRAHVAIAGLGGVGSWCAEALVRSGVGRLTLIDMDHVAASNLNRQIHALRSTVGVAKIQAMAERIADINPTCQVTGIDEFVTVGNAADLIGADIDVVVDAIDQASVKAAMVSLCQRRDQAVVVCGAAGARTDPLALRQSDLALVTGDRLLARTRSILRREHGFGRQVGHPFGVLAVHSRQTPVGQSPVAQSQPNRGGLPQSQLACAGYGSAVMVTGAMGFAAAAATIAFLDVACHSDSSVADSARIDDGK